MTKFTKTLILLSFLVLAQLAEKRKAVIAQSNAITVKETMPFAGVSVTHPAEIMLYVRRSGKVKVLIPFEINVVALKPNEPATEYPPRSNVLVSGQIRPPFPSVTPSVPGNVPVHSYRPYASPVYLPNIPTDPRFNTAFNSYGPVAQQSTLYRPMYHQQPQNIIPSQPVPVYQPPYLPPYRAINISRILPQWPRYPSQQPHPVSEVPRNWPENKKPVTFGQNTTTTTTIPPITTSTASQANKDQIIAPPTSDNTTSSTPIIADIKPTSVPNLPGNGAPSENPIDNNVDSLQGKPSHSNGEDSANVPKTPENNETAILPVSSPIEDNVYVPKVSNTNESAPSNSTVTIDSAYVPKIPDNNETVTPTNATVTEGNGYVPPIQETPTLANGSTVLNAKAEEVAEPATANEVP